MRRLRERRRRLRPNDVAPTLRQARPRLRTGKPRPAIAAGKRAMPVHPELQGILDDMLAAGLSDADAMSPEAMRELLAAMPMPPPLPDLPKVEQREYLGRAVTSR
jgi:hypothetical protein